MRRALATALLLAGGCLGAGASAAPPADEVLVRIAVPSEGNGPPAGTLAATAAYLDRRIEGYDFIVLRMSAAEIRATLAAGNGFEFVLLDPGSFVELAHDFALAPVATRLTRQHDRAYPRFGATIVARADRSDITTLADLHGKSLMAPQAAFGSFHLAWRELNARGIYPYRDLAEFVLEAEPPEAAIEALLAGEVDAAAVPTGVLERLAAADRLDPGAVRVLHPFPPTQGFPLARSTPLYPDWAFAATADVAHELADAVGGALQAMAPDDPAALAAGYAGWTAPLSYEPVLALYRELHLGPFRQPPLRVLARENRVVLALSALALLVLVGASAFALRVNRRLAEAVRRRARTQEHMQMFVGAVQQTADAVMITDPDGVIEYVNPAFTRITGYAPEEVRGRTPAVLKSGQHDESFYRRLWDTIRRGGVFRDEFVNRRKDGALFWEQKSIIPIRDAGGRIAHFVATGRDITEQRRTEEEVQLRREQLAHTARVNVIGEMASSLAHEISQPLTAIINYAQGSIRRLRAGDMEQDRLMGVLEQIVAQAQRVTDAVVALRRLVSRRKPQRVQTDINALVMQVVALASGEMRKRGIGVTLDLHPNLPAAVLDDVQIEQVILNLLRNGAEALASADVPARELRVSTGLADDGALEISISDTGPGLPPQLAAKLFEPFFTTKPEGVGLGLAVSRTIIETHGGQIWVTPNPERGVTFRFTVPVETQTHER